MNSPKKRTTTLVGILVMAVAWLGLLAGGLNMIGYFIFKNEPDSDKMIGASLSSQAPIYLAEGIVALVISALLFLAGKFIFNRNLKCMTFLVISFLIVAGLTVFRIVAQLPKQLENLTETEKFGQIGGVFGFVVLTLCFYLSIFAYLKRDETRAEFGLTKK